ncbi:hypothetical protein GB931_07450 [Modestobacter sp. I12A-02628]|uniref:Schlafen AlbA-2 domain-containing protein n=1 Tax=Goekera deserti TaxID=2497753 RepID=A0A7K3WHR4_9ACTN|nr:RNA-binding domain-containing protein [Goekera deserti]MPQ97758.1 hypothetical protein [Goekera deserti]NDI48403.1 hypothetical protein [Goekera deserti]NEL56004.1 hypothetical protein [Goekera deserti]
MPEALAVADSALIAIGDGWSASSIEQQVLDFKDTPPADQASIGRVKENFYRLLAETAVCFANGEGGAIVIGVKDHAPTRAEAITGVDTRRFPLEEMVRNIHQRTSPAVTVRPLAREPDGKTVYVLVVPRGHGVHGTTQGVYKYRFGDQCLPLRGEQLRGLRTVRERYDWSAGSSGCGIEALSRAAMERAATLLRLNGHTDLAHLAETDPVEYCRNTSLLVGDELTRAAVILFGTPDAIRSCTPEWGVNVQTRESPGSEARVLLRGTDEAPALVTLLDRLNTVLATLATVLTIRVGAEQVELIDYPPDALREILANAFAHRDWEQPGLVEIVHSPDELVVTSPGGLLPTLRVDRLLHDAASPRNELLTVNLARLKLAEMSGLGFDRAFREVARLGKEPPALEDGVRFRVSLPGGRGDAAFARFIRGDLMPPALTGDVDVLMALTALRRTKTLDAGQLSSRLQRSSADVQRVLSRMADAGLVEATRASARRSQPRYALTASSIAGMRTAVSYASRSIDEDDDKILRHLRRHGRITNEDVRAYLDCDVATARNRLTRLRKRGLIDFAPVGPRRGSHVVYVLTSGISTGAAPGGATTDPDDPDRLF